MIHGKYGKGRIPIPLYISDYRRKMIIQNLKQKCNKCSLNEDGEKAQKIALAFERKQLETNKKRKNMNHNIDYLERKLNSIKCYNYRNNK